MRETSTVGTRLRVEPAGEATQRGIALIAVMVFALIVALVGLAFFGMASYESEGAQYRQRSTEAFYLADGAMERARGEFLVDINWRGPVAATLLGSGSYTVTVQDTTLAGEAGVALHAEGMVGEAERGVEMTGRVNSLVEEWGMVAGRNIDIRGNITVDGQLHANFNAYFGPGDAFLKGGTYDEGYAVSPPPIYTEPQYWGDTTTYYRVIGVPKAPPVNEYAKIYKFDWATGTFLLTPETITSTVVNNRAAGLYEFTFNAIETKKYFDTIFNKDPGSQAVVVDFGQPDASGTSVANLDFTMSDALWSLKATLINTRFEGVNPADRVAPCGGLWKGGSVIFGSKLTFAPDNCVALIAHELGSSQGHQPNAQGSLGTFDHPGLTYVTGTVNGIKGDLEVWGALIALCDINTQGGPTIHHMPEILNCLPFDYFDSQGSGFLRLQEWREVPL